jgi:hypothetical protein
MQTVSNPIVLMLDFYYTEKVRAKPLMPNITIGEDVFPATEFDISNFYGAPVSVDDRNETSCHHRNYKLFQNYPNSSICQA